ncbi:MAG: DUF1465 family protein [Sphingobium sp.]|nr:DUF1465 family protein [Sphingobium sp.]
MVDSLYTEAMLLTDEARSYFDGYGTEERDRLDTLGRLTFACESLKVTTRLMHVIAWLLAQKAWRRGEISEEALADPGYRLGAAERSNEAALAIMPERARELAHSSVSLYVRVRRLQQQKFRPVGIVLAGSAAAYEGNSGPVRELLERLERSI